MKPCHDHADTSTDHPFGIHQATCTFMQYVGLANQYLTACLPGILEPEVLQLSSWEDGLEKVYLILLPLAVPRHHTDRPSDPRRGDVYVVVDMEDGSAIHTARDRYHVYGRQLHQSYILVKGRQQLINLAITTYCTSPDRARPIFGFHSQRTGIRGWELELHIAHHYIICMLVNHGHNIIR